MNPEHLHILLSHVPYVGVGLAVIPILIGILGRSRAALGSGLLLAAVCGWSVPLVTNSGEEAAERYANPSQHGIVLDEGARDWVHVHEEDAQGLSMVIYATACVATIAFLLCVVRVSGAFVLSWIVVILCLASLLVGLVIADSGIKIRRPDFRAVAQSWSISEDRPDTIHGRLDVLPGIESTKTDVSFPA